MLQHLVHVCHADMADYYKLSVEDGSSRLHLVTIKRRLESRWYISLRQAFNVVCSMGCTVSWGSFYKHVCRRSKATVVPATSEEKGVLVQAGALSPQAPSAVLVSAASLLVPLRNMRALPPALGTALAGLVEGTAMLEPLECEVCSQLPSDMCQVCPFSATCTRLEMELPGIDCTACCALAGCTARPINPPTCPFQPPGLPPSPPPRHSSPSPAPPQLDPRPAPAAPQPPPPPGGGCGNTSTSRPRRWRPHHRTPNPHQQEVQDY